MPLPTFIVIGVAKAGTTSFFRYLDQHPQVFVYPEKGTNFFGYEDARDWRWHDEGEPPLLRHFHVRTFEGYEDAFSGVTDEIAIGEVSPQYFRCPTAAERIHNHLPDVKLIASLRNPAERAFSGFLMRTRRGEPVGSAYEELTAESSHVRESFYFRRLKRFYDAFPREQVKIYVFEEFKREPERVMEDMLEFIGVDESVLPDTSPRYNPARVPRSRLANRLLFHPKVIRGVKTILPERAHGLAKRAREWNQSPPPSLPDDLRERLLGFYREDIDALEELLQRDLTIWREGS